MQGYSATLSVLMMTLICTVASGLVGAAFGYAAQFVFVIGLYPIALGLTVGAVLSWVGLMRGAALGVESVAIAMLCVGVGWGAFQLAEDRTARAAFQWDYAEARRAASGVPPDVALSEDELPFYGDGADAALEAQVVAQTGVGGLMGRWLFRAEDGVRLIGGRGGGRSLNVGVPGAALYALLEISLALLVVGRILRRVRQRRSELD